MQGTRAGASNVWYAAVSTLGIVPLGIYGLLHPDLRAGLWRRYFPEPMRPPSAGARLWIHAASGGEVRLAEAFARTWLDQHPDSAFLLTVDTQAGVKSAESGPWNFVRRFPFDAYPCVHRMFRRFRPHAVVQVEMELWPGLLGIAQRYAVPVAVINARMRPSEEKAFSLLNRLLNGYLSTAHFLARSSDDLAILRRLGVHEPHLLVTGEMKIEQALQRHMPASVASRSALLAVSTHPGEEEIILAAFRRLKQNRETLKLIIAPRHPRRATGVARMAAREGWSVSVVREIVPSRIAADVVVESGWGRMEAWLQSAAAAFVGGTLVKGFGGHNVLEPVLHGVPAITGRYHEDWAPWVKLLREVGALSVVAGEDELVRALQATLDTDLSTALYAARRVLARHEGTTARNVSTVWNLMNGGAPHGDR